jgi:LmbE family N-acetylglucosaminyl deacetylase
VTDIDLLAVAAHRDDAELTCGGTLIRAARQGYRTAVVDLTQGEMGTRGSAATRAAEASRAAEVMGLDKAGHIGAGCWADLLFVEGDPLKDLGVLRSPKGVYARGVAAV